MRIAVMGAGSIGGYFGGMLAQGGHEVTLIARGPHLAAIRQNGLKIITDEEEFTVGCNATDSPNEVGVVDLILLTVKTYHNAQAVPAMLPMIGPDTLVLCLQNGIDSYQAAAEAVGQEKVLPGAAYIEAGHPSAGVVTQSGDVVRIEFGELSGGDSQRGRALQRTLEDSGIPAGFQLDIYQALWSKFLFIGTLAGVSSLARESLALLMPRPEWRRVVIGCLREIESVALASGIKLEPTIVADTIEYMEGSLESLQASMHTDLLAGRPLELEALNGAVIRAGDKAGTATPINGVIYAMLKPYEMGQTQ